MVFRGVEGSWQEESMNCTKTLEVPTNEEAEEPCSEPCPLAAIDGTQATA